ncbi:MAG: DUF3795 domain-containing protein [Anaerolineae bacterium]|nr:DUF3795 domain-containing protein [Anaerolineae bacterium]
MTATHDPRLAVCGLFCGACYHYRASFPEGRHLLAASGKRLEAFVCRGCLSEQHYIHPGCAQCVLRACAAERGIPDCGACDAYPCETWLAFQNDGRVHHRYIAENLQKRRDLGTERWLKYEETRWRCACGQPFSWYESHCSSCGALLNSYGPDPTQS